MMSMSALESLWLSIRLASFVMRKNCHASAKNGVVHAQLCRKQYQHNKQPGWSNQQQQLDTKWLNTPCLQVSAWHTVLYI